MRSRYEIANNSYAAGMISTLANDCIGTGPRLQMLTPDRILNRAIEEQFRIWSRAIRLPQKLRTMRRALCVDGEAFGLWVNNEGLSTPVKLDLRLIEADQVSSPFLNPIDPLRVDGIWYDVFGNPIQYDLLRFHPGDYYQLGLIADPIDARLMIHWFRVDRPGQLRGIPEITPALLLYPQLRRYTLAVLAAAETAADFAAILYSEMPPDTGTEDDVEPFIPVEIERRMMTTLPMGWKMSQFKPEQPATGYAEFKKEILNEIARCINMPFNVAAGNSSNYNYSSGRLDHQVYHKALGVDRADIELIILEPVLTSWIQEAWLAYAGLIPDGPDRIEGWAHQWFWDGFGHIDPHKDAQAQQTRLQNCTTTLKRECAREGLDSEVIIRERAKELEMMSRYGIPLTWNPLATLPMPAEDEEIEVEPEEEEEESQEEKVEDY